MADLVEVLIEKGLRKVLFSRNNIENIRIGSKVVVECENCIDLGEVISFSDNKEIDIAKVLRIATTQDLEKYQELKKYIDDDIKKVSEKVKLNDISLKLVDVQRSLDNKRLLVIYTAVDRVDFRNLVKDLAGLFKMRVEMRQISERDEAKLKGCCGICGQELCCKRFLSQPLNATIKMAKIQGLSLSGNKINGCCGKPMCCLSYENSQYSDILNKMPPLGANVTTPQGIGHVVYQDILREKVAVKLDKTENENGDIAKFNVEEVIQINSKEDNNDR